MELIDLLNTAARGWEQVTPNFDPRLEDHYVMDAGEIKVNAGCYRRTAVGAECPDQLSHVAVADLIATFDSEGTDAEQLHEATRAVGQLSHWLSGITSELLTTTVGSETEPGEQQAHCPTCECT